LSHTTARAQRWLGLIIRQERGDLRLPEFSYNFPFAAAAYIVQEKPTDEIG